MLFKLNDDGSMDEVPIRRDSSYVVTIGLEKYKGVVPASASQLMQLRLEAANSPKEGNMFVYGCDEEGNPHDRINGHGMSKRDFLMYRSFGVSDGIAIHNNGRYYEDKIKFVYSPTGLWIPKSSTRFVDEGGFDINDIILSQEQYDKLDGPEFEYSKMINEWGVDNVPMTKQWAKQHPLWLAAAKGDKHLLSEYVDLTYAELQESHRKNCERNPDYENGFGSESKLGFGVFIHLDPHLHRFSWDDSVQMDTINRSRLGLNYTLAPLGIGGEIELFYMYTELLLKPLEKDHEKYHSSPLMIGLPTEKANCLDGLVGLLGK